MCPDREERASKKKAEEVEENPRKESDPGKSSVNVTIGEDWEGNTDYGGLMFCQVMADNTKNKTPKIEYQHALIHPGGNIIPTWFLLENQYTANLF